MQSFAINRLFIELPTLVITSPIPITLPLSAHIHNLINQSLHIIKDFRFAHMFGDIILSDAKTLAQWFYHRFRVQIKERGSSHGWCGVFYISRNNHIKSNIQVVLHFRFPGREATPFLGIHSTGYRIDTKEIATAPPHILYTYRGVMPPTSIEQERISLSINCLSRSIIVVSVITQNLES